MQRSRHVQHAFPAMRQLFGGLSAPTSSEQRPVERIDSAGGASVGSRQVLQSTWHLLIPPLHNHLPKDLDDDSELGVTNPANESQTVNVGKVVISMEEYALLLSGEVVQPDSPSEPLGGEAQSGTMRMRIGSGRENSHALNRADTLCTLRRCLVLLDCCEAKPQSRWACYDRKPEILQRGI
eukprot:3247965-Rhodomonas_salina.1